MDITHSGLLWIRLAKTISSIRKSKTFHSNERFYFKFIYTDAYVTKQKRPKPLLFLFPFSNLNIEIG